MGQTDRTWVQAKALLATATATVLYSPGSGNYFYLTSLSFMNTGPSSTSGNSVVRICTGATDTSILGFDGSTGWTAAFDFGDKGYRMPSAGDALMYVNSSSATVRVMAIGYIV